MCSIISSDLMLHFFMKNELSDTDILSVALSPVVLPFSNFLKD